ncbi:hypothetical protein M3Y99_01126300 [Aphelenchoides fujianensis]|nr:hypothetical protein M3Y99_01126300 [Aphelenchoides fujianensis]
MRSFSAFVLLLLAFNGALAQAKPELKNGELLNEGQPGCARFDQTPIAFSGRCLAHKLTLDVARSESFSIGLTGLDYAEFSGKADVVVRVNRCRFAFRVSCEEDESCTVSYPLPNTKGTFNASLIRFVVKDELVTAEGTLMTGGMSHEIYKCHSTFRSLDAATRCRYEVRIYLSEEFSGHQFELIGGNVRYYRNGRNKTTTPVAPGGQEEAEEETTPETTTEATTTPAPLTTSSTTVVPSSPAAAVGLIEGARIGTKKVDDQPQADAAFNSKVTVEKMADSPDGKFTLVDLLIRTRVSVPKN